MKLVEIAQKWYSIDSFNPVGYVPAEPAGRTCGLFFCS